MSCVSCEVQPGFLYHSYRREKLESYIPQLSQEMLLVGKRAGTHGHTGVSLSLHGSENLLNVLTA
jgi:hypothetical protein